MLFNKIFYNSNNFTLTDKHFEKGTFGTVYVVNNKINHLQYAAKFINIDDNIDNDEPAILTQEFSKHSTLDHPSIVKINSINFRSFINLREYQPIVITEYFPKGSLKGMLYKKKDSEFAKKWNITKRYICLLGIADAMRYLHDHEILHLNLKPENVLLDENYYPKVCDFGYSICFPKMYYESMKTNFSNLFYLPPEMITDEGYGKSVDVYAFSIIAYEIITEKVPYIQIEKKNEIDEFLNNVCRGKRPMITNDLTEEMAKLLSKCWCNDSDKRPTFDQIVNLLTSDINFYPKSVDLNEINKYIKSVLNKKDINITNIKALKNTEKSHELIEQLMSAIKSDDINQVEKILSNEMININEKITINNAEITALHYAVEKENIDIIQCLLNMQDIDVNIPYYYIKQNTTNDFDGSEEKTALHIAVEKNNFDIVKLLLTRSDIDINAPFKYIKNSKEEVSEKTALHMAVENEDIRIVELLLERPEIDINYLFKSFSTSYNYRNIGKIGNTKEDTIEKTALHIAVGKKKY